jgi:hypothetical protein
LTPSKQLGAWHCPPLHTPLEQSPATTQELPLGHFAQLDPPQSTSLSVPFFTPSEHVAAWQVPLAHTRLRQSVPTEQVSPVLQPMQMPPPQSTSVSRSFW